MVRLREFDPDEALDKAMGLFWQKGYAETSVRDLVQHTGVAHAGLYSVFGGKREIYLAALDRYDSIYGDRLIGPLEKKCAGRAEVEGFFETVLNVVKSGQFGNGCFMCNTAVEFGNQDGDIEKKAMRNIDRMTAGFKSALRRAKKKGEVRSDLNVSETASFLVNTFYGVAVFSRAKAPSQTIQQTVRLALQVLD